MCLPSRIYFKFLFVLGLSLIAIIAQARDPIRVAALDSSGKEIFVIEQVYNGKRQKNPNTKPSRDPEKYETDFYQITYRNMSSEPVTVKRMALGLRNGAGTMVGVRKNNSEDSWGAGLQEMDLALKPMFSNNVLGPKRTQTGEYFISTNGPNFIDRIIQIEHVSKTYELKWEMPFIKGD
ncbi:MAG TPA: hypothetical protein PKC80_00570 [Burkholderiaceae bacterium]|nr:hypothetical protein [Burkholderiaceae bacterium]